METFCALSFKTSTAQRLSPELLLRKPLDGLRFLPTLLSGNCFSHSPSMPQLIRFLHLPTAPVSRWCQASPGSSSTSPPCSSTRRRSWQSSEGRASVSSVFAVASVGSSRHSLRKVRKKDIAIMGNHKDYVISLMMRMTTVVMVKWLLHEP